LERRYIQNGGQRRELALRETLLDQAIDLHIESRQRFTATGGRSYQRVPARHDRRPGILLRRRGRTKALLEPGAGGGVKSSKGGGFSIHRPSSTQLDRYT